MKLLNTATIEVKKSKFIAYYYELDDINNMKEITDNLKKEHKKARHVVYAYKYGTTAGKSDDKEPSGTAALPIYQLLEMNHCENKFIAVVRYFGGIKLGAAGLTRAYRQAASSVIKKEV